MIHSQYSKVFRDQLYKHLETVQEGDFDSFVTKLVQAGSTLEYLKYAEPLFEIIFVGGLLQPGGSFLDDGAPISPFTIANAKEPVEVGEIKNYIGVIDKLIRRYCHFLDDYHSIIKLSINRYKYLQKPLDDSALPTLLQYVHRWPPAQTAKFATAVGILLSQGLANASCLQGLTKDHLVKNGACFIFYVDRLPS